MKNFEAARAIADAVLYEGYALYPYRPGSVKNRTRWTFGGLVPREGAGAESWTWCCEMLVEAPGTARITALLRFLTPLARQPYRVTGGEREAVAELTADGVLHQAWIEATEKSIPLEPLSIDALRSGQDSVFDYAEYTTVNPVSGGDIVICQPQISARIHLQSSRVGDAYRLTVTVSNESPANSSPRAVLESSQVVVLLDSGAFASQQDPPERLQAAAAVCKAQGAWPVLVGDPVTADLAASDPTPGSRMMLCSPIILPDRPAVAPESLQDLHDGCEIDEILTLRILALSPEEKIRMANLDERVRRILERAESIGPAQMLKLHGVCRSAATWPSVGAKVRLRPRTRGDILDLALAGMHATVTEVKPDVEGRTWVSVTLDDDPGRDLGAAGLPGHRFFYEPSELEPVKADE